MKFEDIITESAKRVASQQNAKLHIPVNPLQQNHHYWGWIATPAAAIVGLVFGLSFQQFTDNEPNNTISQVVDTVFVPDVQHDTLWLTRVEENEHIVEKERVVEKVVWREREPLVEQAATSDSSTPAYAKEQDPVCTSVSCDGINYGILASN